MRGPRRRSKLLSTRLPRPFAGNAGIVIDLGEYYMGDVSSSLSRSTLVANSGPSQIRLTRGQYDEYGVRASIVRTIIASAPQGSAVSCNGDVTFMLSCCDLYGNAGGDWTGCIADQGSIANNLSADPLFCGDHYPAPCTLHSNSPCAGGPCGIVGARPIGCGASSVPAMADARDGP